MILLTPEFCLSAGYSLAVHCRNCRVLRNVDLTALCASGREKQAIGEMTFRCRMCGEVGTPQVMGWVLGERTTWE